MGLFQQNMGKIFLHPTSLFALLGLIILILAYINTKKIKLDTRLITRIGIALALATILKIFKLYHLPQGGSITLGSMMPILLMSFVHSPAIGYLTGFLYGIINLIIGPYILHPVQVLFDYPLPFMAMGLAGYFHNYILGAAVAIFGRFICHFISGAVFFGSYAPPDVSPYIYSLAVNGVFMGIEGLICLLLVAIFPWKQLQFIMKKDK